MCPCAVNSWGRGGNCHGSGVINLSTGTTYLLARARALSMAIMLTLKTTHGAGKKGCAGRQRYPTTMVSGAL